MSRDAIRDERSDRASAGRGPAARRHRDRRRLRPDLLALEDRRLMATFTVTIPVDVVIPPALMPVPGTLRWAVELADGASSDSTIEFDLGASTPLITLSQGPLELSNIHHATTIEGPAGGLTVSGGGASRVFQIDAKVTATLSGLTITGGSAIQGGGVSNKGTATLTGCTVSGNTAGSGGGLINEGTATLTGCTVSGNTAGYGGGLFDGGIATLYGCTVSGNSATKYGGGLNNSGTATLYGCTISGNSAAKDGGGLINEGTAALYGCTISGNSAAGGGLFNAGKVMLTGCTVSGNSSAIGGGGLHAYSGTAHLSDTIVAGNIGGIGASDIAGPAAAGVTGANDLIGPGGSGGIADGTDGDIVLTGLGGLGLAPLANNGGPTRTMALLPGSPAINAGRNALDVDSHGVILATDQRGTGFARIVGGTADIGAYESSYLTTRITLSAPGATTSTFGQSVTFTATVVVIDGGTGVPGGSVEFFDGRTPLGYVALDGSGKATLTTSALGLGSRSITATYGGNAQSTTATSGPVSVSVVQDGSQVVLVPRAVHKKKKVVSLGLEARIEPLGPGGGVPTGTVTFELMSKKKVKVLGTAALVGGEATLAVKPNVVLKKSITIVYGGDADFGASAEALTLSPSSLTTRARPMALGRAAVPGSRRLAGEAPTAKRDRDRLMAVHEPDSSRPALAWRLLSSTSPAPHRRRGAGPWILTEKRDTPWIATRCGTSGGTGRVQVEGRRPGGIEITATCGRTCWCWRTEGLMATFAVISTADTAPALSPASGTLRWAVEKADAASSASTIDFELGAAAPLITLSQG